MLENSKSAINTTTMNKDKYNSRYNLKNKLKEEIFNIKKLTCKLLK